MPHSPDLLTGKLEVHRNGTAHFQPETKGAPEVFISGPDLGTGMHGDVVQVRIKGKPAPRGRPVKPSRRLEGVVTRVVARATDRIVGLLQQNERKEFSLLPDDPRFQRAISLRPGPTPLPRRPRAGDKAVVRLGPWTDPRANPTGELIEVLGPAGAPGVDMLSVIRKYGLESDFPRPVFTEAERIPEEIHHRVFAEREDLRRELVITIDPDDARDFDNAINVTSLRSGRGEHLGWMLGVHIADVSHYVRPGTALDVEARRRGNSTYLADRVLPMLPERLSNGICSLKPGVERLTFSAFMEFSPTGKMRSARFARTVIRSAARLSYRQAFAILQGQDEVPPLPPAMEQETRGLATVSEGAPVSIAPAVGRAVRDAWELASVLRKARFEHGSLDLDFPEVKVWLDAHGKAVRLEKVVNDISHQLVEECMLAANEAVARELKHRLIPSVYRIHEEPDPVRLGEFRQLLLQHRVKVGDLTQRREVQKALAAIVGTPEEYALKLQFLKSLRRAAYDPKPQGHYGLAKVNYTHFTSPIRRYADLMVHRSLAAAGATRASHPARAGQKPKYVPPVVPPAELAALAQHLSETERLATDAERESALLKKLEYFERQLAQRRPSTFRAIVVDVRPFGLRVELPDVMMMGMLHVNELRDDYYLYDAARMSFTGRRTRRRFKLGDEIPVLVSRVDMVKRQVDFALATE